MSKRCLRLMAAFVAVVYLCIPGRSQSTEYPTTLKGELRSEENINLHEYFVELADSGHYNEIHRADVQFDGSFQLRDIRSGTYMLRVTTLTGTVIQQDLVTVAPQTGPLTVRLRTLSKPSAPGTISLIQLRHPPSHKAFQAVASAQRFSQSGQTGKAVEELEKAIRISPEYADAYNNLAVQHMRMGRFEEAAAELTRAISIAGPNPMTLSNLAYAQRQLNRFPEAIASARAALRLDSGSAPAHLILGSILAADPRTRAEGVTHLEEAAETLPSARTALEQVRRAP